MMHRELVIVGAGLQGVSVALALAARGHQVTLIERLAEPMMASSRRNEGKIHLGFVYALDESGETTRRMLEGAFSFAALLDRWCGALPWNAWRSEGFRYAVMPESLADIDQIEAAYERIRVLVPEVAADAGLEPRYLGRCLDWLWRRTALDRGRPQAESARGATMIETEEVAVDPRALADHLQRAVALHPLIEVHPNTVVRSAEDHNGGVRLHLDQEGTRSTLDALIVVNCAWHDQERLDRTIGVEPAAPDRSYRVKYQVLVRPSAGVSEVAPVTMVQGPYGDVVPWNDGTVYVSWYPESRTYFGPTPPPDDLDEPDRAARVARRSLDAISAYYPQLAGAEIVSSLAGVIIGSGATDISDRNSGLHERTAFGIREIDGWWSVDPGKLTTAPLLGDRAASRISAVLE